MPVTGKVLEDSIRLSRIRRIKIMLYLVQAVLLIVLAFVFTFLLGGATVRPTLFIPLDTFAAIMVLLMLIICVESFFFRILEIRFARSSSARHLMAKNSIRRALAIAIVTGVLAIILTVPGIRGSIEHSTNREFTLTPLDSEASFYSSDPFSWTSIERVTVSASNPVHVYLVDDTIFKLYEGNTSALYTFRLNTDSFRINQTQNISLPAGVHTKFHLVLNDMESPGTGATAIGERGLSSTISGMVGLLMISFVAANLAWVAYLMPIERKYSVSSIYK
jgi:hypothetical protein